MLTITSLILLISFIFIAWEKWSKVTIAMFGASLMLVITQSPSKTVFSHVDFGVIFLLVSMMIIVHITARSGVFKWIAFEMLKHTKGNPKAILITIGLFTAVFSAFLDNVTTVVLVIPVILAISKQLKIDPIPFFITTILASNIGGTATLIGDPPNIIIGSAAGLSFMDFIKELTGIITIIFILSMTVLLFLFKDVLKPSPEHTEKIEQLDNTKTIKNKKLMIRSVTVLSLVILGFLFHNKLHIDAYVIALMGASFLLFFETPKQIIQEVEWTTIFFFIGLFLIIGGFAESGGIKLLSEYILNITGGNLKVTSMILLWASGFFSAIIDNIPYTATMVPMINELKSSMDVYPLWWSLSLGACLGGNATIIGAAANVIVIEAANATGHKITFMRFFNYGILITIISLIISSLYLYIRFFM